MDKLAKEVMLAVVSVVVSTFVQAATKNVARQLGLPSRVVGPVAFVATRAVLARIT